MYHITLVADHQKEKPIWVAKNIPMHFQDGGHYCCDFGSVSTLNSVVFISGHSLAAQHFWEASNQAAKPSAPILDIPTPGS